MRGTFRLTKVFKVVRSEFKEIFMCGFVEKVYAIYSGRENPGEFTFNSNGVVIAGFANKGEILSLSSGIFILENAA